MVVDNVDAFYVCTTLLGVNGEVGGWNGAPKERPMFLLCLQIPFSRNVKLNLDPRVISDLALSPVWEALSVGTVTHSNGELTFLFLFGTHQFGPAGHDLKLPPTPSDLSTAFRR